MELIMTMNIEPGLRGAGWCREPKARAWTSSAQFDAI